MVARAPPVVAVESNGAVVHLARGLAVSSFVFDVVAVDVELSGTPGSSVVADADACVIRAALVSGK